MSGIFVLVSEILIVNFKIFKNYFPENLYFVNDVYIILPLCRSDISFDRIIIEQQTRDRSSSLAS
jgi:hypothetical protein